MPFMPRLAIVAVVGLSLSLIAGHAPADQPLQPDEATGADASVFEAPADRVLHVDPEAGDDQSLTPDDAATPLRTLARALHMARGGLDRGENIRIVLEDGVYREYTFGLQMNDINEAGYLVIEARHPGKAEIRGSVDWTGSANGVAWTADDDGRYYKPWPYNWQFAYHHHGGGGSSPDGSREDPDQQQYFSAVSRPEWVMYNGETPLQIAGARSRMAAGERSFGSLDEMGTNTVYIDDIDSRLYVRLADNADPNEPGHKIEVGMSNRSGTEMFWPRAEFELQNLRNLKLSGLVVSHMVGSVEAKATRIRDSHNVLIDNCRFEYNSSRSLEFENLTDVTVRDTQAVHNGSSGFAPNNCRNLVMERVQGSYNNIKGPWGDLFGWSIGGNKTVGKRTSLVRIEDSVFSHNQTDGLWFDFCGIEPDEGANIVIRNSEMTDNVGSGVFIEITEGPVVVENCTVLRNGRGGIQVANATHVTLRRNELAENVQLRYDRMGAQVFIWDAARGSQFPEYSSRLHVHDNTMTASGENIMFGPLKIWGTLPELYARTMSEAIFHGNQYHHESREDVFDVVVDEGYQRVDFATWRDTFGFDTEASSMRVEQAD